MTNTLTRFSTRLLGATLGLHALTLRAFAQDPRLPLPEKPGRIPSLFGTVTDTIRTIFNLVIIIAGTIFVILLLVGGIQYLTAAGNEEATGKAKRLIVDSVVGLIIVLAAWAIGTFILARLGLGQTTGGGLTGE